MFIAKFGSILWVIATSVTSQNEKKEREREREREKNTGTQ